MGNEGRRVLTDAIIQLLLVAFMIGLGTWIVERIYTLSKKTSESIINIMERIGI